MTTSTTGSNIDTSSDIKSINKTKTKSILKNVVDLSLNQNKYLIQPDRKVLFSQQTTFKNEFSTQFQHVLSRQEYSKIIETLNSTIDPMLFKLQVNNWLLFIAIIMFPCIIVTSIFASMGRVFIPTIIVGTLSFFIGIFAIFRKTYLDSNMAEKIAKDIQSFNNRFSHRQISLEYLVTTIYNQNQITYQINLHLIYPIISSTTPEMYSLNSSSQFLNNLNSSTSFNNSSLGSSINSNSGNISNSPASILSPSYQYIKNNHQQQQQQQNLPIYNPVTGREYIYYNQNSHNNNNNKQQNNHNHNHNHSSSSININEDQYYDVDNSSEYSNLINKQINK